jgi:hypothetical protein
VAYEDDDEFGIAKEEGADTGFLKNDDESNIDDDEEQREPTFGQKTTHPPNIQEQHTRMKSLSI